MRSEPLVYEIDAIVTRWINGCAGANALSDFLMIWISAIGVPLLVLAVAAQWWRRGDRGHIRHVLVASGFSFLLGLAFNQFILFFIHRLRPYEVGVTRLLIARSGDFSFPSDHATATFAIASALLLHGWRRQGLAFLIAAFVVAFSRVYIGTIMRATLRAGR